MKSFEPPSVNQCHEAVAVGLFDMPTFAQLVDVLCRVFGWQREVVQDRLFREALQPGWNVTAACRAAGVVPHEFTPALEALYAQTDAFVFELVTCHSSSLCWDMDRRVCAAVERSLRGRANRRVLVLGDGIGSDSLRLTRMGHSVTYFDFEGFSSKLAEYRFRQAGFDQRIRRVHRASEISDGAFDLVVCREVLEHVPSPPAVIQIMNRCLVLGGLAIVTESFSEVTPWFPTHLLSNIRYVGRVCELFAAGGFVLQESGTGSLCVFRKAGEPGRRACMNLLEGKWRLRLRRAFGLASLPS
jgi:SAM-dependent methyltransferase